MFHVRGNPAKQKGGINMEIAVRTRCPYTIRIQRGILKQAGEACRERFPKGNRVAVISDSHVFPLYGESLLSSLKASGFSPVSFCFHAGEASKTLSTVEKILLFLAEEKLTRTDFLIALGGGVTGDMAGFAAACYLRGIPFVQIPTSLLAQVDSSVGGKTGVDLPQGKNLVGAFHQPALVLIDPDTLDTLPPAFFADGMGEVIKYGCIRSPELFSRLETGNIREQMEDVIRACVEIKRDIVERDELDTGERMLLNFGHTLGHALEKLHGFSALSHGAAVGIGMVKIAQAGEAAGITEPGTAKRIAALLQRYSLPIDDPADLEDLLDATASDKKSAGSQIRPVLLRRIGESFFTPMPREEFRRFCAGIKPSSLPDTSAPTCKLP